MTGDTNTGKRRRKSKKIVDLGGFHVDYRARYQKYKDTPQIRSSKRYQIDLDEFIEYAKMPLSFHKLSEMLGVSSRTLRTWVLEIFDSEPLEVLGFFKRDATLSLAEHVKKAASAKDQRMLLQLAKVELGIDEREPDREIERERLQLERTKHQHRVKMDIAKLEILKAQNDLNLAQKNILVSIQKLKLKVLEEESGRGDLAEGFDEIMSALETAIVGTAVYIKSINIVGDGDEE